MKPDRAVHAAILSALLAAPAAVVARPPGGAPGGAPAPAAVPPAAAPAQDAAAAARLRLALVNGEAITLADLRDAFAARHFGHGTLLAGREVLETVLNKAIDERLLVQEGRRMGLHETPAFQEAVQAYRDLQRLEVLEERSVRVASEPSAEDVRRAYALLPRRMRLALIETADRAAADSALAALGTGETFDAVARRLSTHPSRTRGGELGWLSWGQLDPVTESVALRTAVGALGGPFAVDGRFRVLRVLEEQRGTPPPLEAVEPRLRAILRERRQPVARAELLAAIRRAHPPAEDTGALTRLLYGTRHAQGTPDPPDDAVLLRTATGLTLTAGRVRERTRRAGLSFGEAWRAAVDDALLIDEARRRIQPDAALRRRVRRFADARVRDELESTVILSDLTLDDAETRAYYDGNTALFTGRPSYHLRHLVLPTRDAAEEARRAVLKGSDFGTLAKRRSIDAATAPKGGDLGWVEVPEDGARGQPAQAVFDLRAGETSPVLETDLGFAVVQVLAVRPGTAPPYETIRHDVARRLMVVKQQARRDAFVGKLRGHAAIKTFPAALDRAVAMQEEAARRRLAAAGPEGRNR
jgi:parvulin-like peptidyl-prolyl isomerase